MRPVYCPQTLFAASTPHAYRSYPDSTPPFGKVAAWYLGQTRKSTATFCDEGGRKHSRHMASTLPWSNHVRFRRASNIWQKRNCQGDFEISQVAVHVECVRDR